MRLALCGHQFRWERSGVRSPPYSVGNHPAKELVAPRVGLVSSGERFDLVQRRKNAPKGAAMFIAHMACTQHGLFDDWRAQRVAAELLGSEDNKREIAEYLTASGGDFRATIVLLAMTLGALESRTAKDAWRSPGGLSAEYLAYLQSVGYVASDIERVIIRARDSEGVYSENCT
jgi:ParB family chromosome partitioning protein